MANSSNISGSTVEELEDRILDLSLKLKNKDLEIKSLLQAQKRRSQKIIHNLKNPIGSIFSFSEIILNSGQELGVEKLRNYISIIKNASNYSIHFLNQTALFSSLSEGDNIFVFEKIDYIELIKNVIERNRPYALEKNISVTTHIEIEELELMVDEEHLIIALMNILNNAIRFSNENTTICIRVIVSEHSVTTMVEDEGIGVSVDDLPKLFQEYYVVNTYSKDSSKCVGLGLSISKRIILGHKGHVKIDSEYGVGSKVTFVLPRQSTQ